MFAGEGILEDHRIASLAFPNRRNLGCTKEINGGLLSGPMKGMKPPTFKRSGEVKSMISE
jgi:hypothetical protein